MDFFFALLEIMVVNIILSGDNAVVIALAGRNLPKKQQTQAILWGSAGAVVLRVLLTIVAVLLLKVPFLQAAGGLLLLWMAVKLLLEEDGDGEDVHSGTTLLAAVRTIIIADIVMSLDNTLAIAAIAKNDYLLLSLGLALSVPIIVFGSKLIMWLMEKLPVIVYIGAGLIAWTAGEMLMQDPKILQGMDYLRDHGMVSLSLRSLVEHAVPALAVVGTLVPCWLINLKRARHSKEILAADEAAARHLDDKLS